MTDHFDDIKNMKPLKRRQDEVSEKIRAIPQIGPDLLKTMIEIRPQEEMRLSMFMIMMGPELWEEYWSVYRHTIELKAHELFSKQEQAKKKSLF